jgi:hypothetical protein
MEILCTTSSVKNNYSLGLIGENRRLLFRKVPGIIEDLVLLANISRTHHSEIGSLIPEMSGNTTQNRRKKMEYF